MPETQSRARVAVVTGAARGIGGAVVSRLTEQGFAVVAVDVSEAVTALGADNVAPLRIDLSDPDAPERVVHSAVERFGGIDFLVNNAGLFLRKPLAVSTAEDWDRIFAINARAPFLLSRAALPELTKRTGSIVNLGSISGLVGLKDQSVYSATKGAVIALTRQLAIEFAPRVRVNAVAPGAVDTEFMAESQRGVTDLVARRAASIALHPLGRMSSPEEVADAIVFLGSAAASGITGAILSVDGGYVAR